MGKTLRLFVLGATGGTGEAVMREALARGHAVSAFVRSPSKITERAPGLTVLEGDPTSAARLAKVIGGHDVVVSALGPRGGGPTTLYSDAARATLDAMRERGVERLLVVSLAVLFPPRGLAALAYPPLLLFLRHAIRDAKVMEQRVKESDPAWTIVRPPRLLGGPPVRPTRIAVDRLPDGGRTITRSELARVLLDLAESGEHARETVGVSR